MCYGNRCASDSIFIILSGLVMVVGIVIVCLRTNVTGWLPFAVVLCMVCVQFFVNYILRKISLQKERFLFPLATLLSSIGLIMVFRLKPQLFMLQGIWIILGWLGFLSAVFWGRHIKKLVNYKYTCGLLGLILLLVTVIFGVDIGGNKNWIVIKSFSIQPSEFAKIFIVLFIAAYLSERREMLLANKQLGFISLPYPRFIGPLLTVWGFTMLLFILQKDLGAALLYFGTTILLTYMAGARLSLIFSGLVLFAVGAICCYYAFERVRTRIDIWLNPWIDPNGSAYQIIQSLFALGSGGLMGSGLTYGSPNLIPEVHTDFIFAAIGEEWGLMGTSSLLMLYMLIVYRGFRIAILATNPFYSLAAGGLSTVVALQILIIVGGVTKLLPLTGITLPFVSYGGSSMVASFVILGLLFAIAELGPYDATKT